jgi:hypothetical protein
VFMFSDEAAMALNPSTTAGKPMLLTWTVTCWELKVSPALYAICAFYPTFHSSAISTTNNQFPTQTWNL